MMNRHLELTAKEVMARLAGKYAEDIQAFGQVEEEVLEMADYFTSGTFKSIPGTVPLKFHRKLIISE